MKPAVILLILFLWGCSSTNETILKPTQSYPEILQGLSDKRQSYLVQYKKAEAAQKKAVLKEVRTFLFKQLTTEIFPSWYDTDWDFNGTTETPKQGQIACGYFVTTTLRDLGLKIPRVKWAQAASETMILAATKDVKRFSNKPMEDIKTWLKTQENEIFIVGLDNHTGFVYNNGSEILFVHSSPVNDNHGVMAEEIMNPSPLTVSKYRVFGKILTDEMIISWLEEKSY